MKRPARLGGHVQHSRAGEGAIGEHMLKGVQRLINGANSIERRFARRLCCQSAACDGIPD